MILRLLLIRLFLKYQHNCKVISSYPSLRVCLKNSVNDIFHKPKIDGRKESQKTRFHPPLTVIFSALSTLALRGYLG